MFDEAAAAQTLFGGTAPADKASGTLMVDAPKPAAPADPATRLFGGHEPATPTNEVERAPRTDDERAASIYEVDELPAPDLHDDSDMRELRNSAERRLYGHAEIQKAIPLSEFESVIGQVVDGRTLDKALVQKGVSELRAMAADLGLDAAGVKVVRDGLARAKDFGGDEGKIIASRESAVERLNYEHGNQAALALRCARAYVAKNPKLAAILDKTRAGDDAATVAIIARKALALHKAGKLRLPSKQG